MRVKKPVVCEAKTFRAGKSHTSLNKLDDFIHLCGGELGPNWQRDKETRRYIPPEGFRAIAGTRFKKFYHTRTEVAEAMGLQPVPIPHVPMQPKRRKSAPGEPGLQTTDKIKGAAANQQPNQKVRNAVVSSFHEGKQIAKLEQCLKNEGLNLQPGWAAERRIRSNGCQYDIFYHAPPGIAAGQGSTKAPAFKSMLEVVRAHKMALQPKTTPQQTSASHPEHACAAAGMQSGGATDTHSSRTAYGPAAHIPPPQPGDIIVLSDSDTDSSDREDAVVHGQSGAGGVAAAATAAAAEGPAVQSSWQAAIQAAILRGCSMQIPSPHLKRRRQ